MQILFYKEGDIALNKKELLKNSMQLAMLKQLRFKKMISDTEYTMILNRLKKAKKNK